MASGLSGAARAGFKRPSRGGGRRGNTLVPTIQELLSPTFVAVDFETANRLGGASACSVALVRVTGGVVEQRLTTYLRPPAEYDSWEFTYLHGISRADTRNAPDWSEVIPQISQFVGDCPVYAHNAPFDAKVWSDLDRHFGLNSVPRRFYCSYRLARSVRPGLVNYKLPTVTNSFVPGFELDHHQADSDAEACALIVAAIQRLKANQ